MNEVCCLECGQLMDQTDTTYPNITTARCNAGDHTGDIYTCNYCECRWIDNFLSGSLEYWSY